MIDGEMMLWAALYANAFEAATNQRHEHPEEAAALYATGSLKRLRQLDEVFGEEAPACIAQMLAPSGPSMEVLRLARESADATITLLMGRHLEPGSLERIAHDSAWALSKAVDAPSTGESPQETE